ncbi:MAG: hydroxyacid dehydrogenase [Opitutales bacterium]|jgi:phosphoglycerate dehydrogenase-like enzyme|nr:hydroxyacid dehydrogenase [Opitutales bacterium]
MKNIICLTEAEIETFLPGERHAEAKALLGPCLEIDPGDIENETEWNNLIKECDAEIILSAWKMQALSHDILDTAPNLKYVCYLAGSVRSKIDRSLIDKGLLVSNWNSSISRTISECALLLVLCCMRQVSHWSQKMHSSGAWKNPETTTQSLFERRVGIHGFGLISQKLIPLLKPFTNKISAHSPGVPQSIFNDLGVAQVDSLETLFSENDVVIELAALTDENYRIVTEDLLRSIPVGGAFVNVGRGAVVDEDALFRVASEGRLQVGLDVYGEEPLAADSPFRGLPNVLLLPHIGGPTTDRRVDAGDHALENLRRYKDAKELIRGFDLKIYDRST